MIIRMLKRLRLLVRLAPQLQEIARAVAAMGGAERLRALSAELDALRSDLQQLAASPSPEAGDARADGGEAASPLLAAVRSNRAALDDMRSTVDLIESRVRLHKEELDTAARALVLRLEAIDARRTA